MKKIASIFLASCMLIFVGAAGATSAQANVTQLASTSFSPSTTVKPNFVPPVDGGSTSPVPSNPGAGSAGRQVCYAIRVITGFTTVWLIIGNVTKPFQVAVYGSEWVCTIVYG